MPPVTDSARIGSAIPRLAPGTAVIQVDGVTRVRSAERPSTGIRGWFGRVLRLAPRSEIALDDIGAFVVARLDGRDLDALVGDVAGHLKLTRREAETSTAEFLRQLINRRLVVVDHPRGVAE
jgi:hypothetical protein